MEEKRYPKFEEEAIARIDKFEEKLAKGEVKWISSEEMDRQLKLTRGQSLCEVCF